jgi:hypothetical protein
LRKLAILTAIGVVLVAGSTPAQAHSTARLSKCSSKQSVVAHMSCAKINIKHGKQLLRFLRYNVEAGTRKSRQSVRRSGLFLIHYGRRQLRDAYSRTRPAHYDGWLCIHNREGSWSDDDWPYYGGLQMSEGWMGVVHHANDLSAMAQMWLAERVASKYGFSYKFMKGQWPNTFPPCANYF